MDQFPESLKIQLLLVVKPLLLVVFDCWCEPKRP